MNAPCCNIVAIEDDPSVVDILKAFATAADVDISVFNRSDEVNVDTVKRADLVILDLHLHDEDGLDIIRLFQHHKVLTPIVICSGMDRSIISASRDLMRDYGLAYAGQLSKPFSFQQFEEALQWSQHHHVGITETRDKYQFTHDDVKKAIENHWVEVVFQPQVNPIQLKLTGVECLARVTHPDHGLCFPDQFIYQVGESGLMDEFTYQVIEQGLTCLLDSAFPEDMIISFNVDPRSINEPFFNWLNELVSNQGINASCICLEITELSGVELSKEVKTILTKLRIRGFHLSLDDYGTGFGTIQELNELPFDELKIDRSFVMSMDSKDTSLAIVRTTTELAAGLNYRLIAEGIENKAQMNTLLALGCEQMQGYLFSRPLHIEAFRQYVMTCEASLESQLITR